ncbi:lipocalin family protein [Winogradskyella pulchriflava]|uniref:Lipocalin family protein n=1 Tax=Winogradskyella pulchriflava TaxID=1110688 RepID=A0ABV6Q4T8_9FLAO
MKNKLIYGLILTLSFSLLSSMCSSDDDGSGSNNNAQEIAQIESAVESGTWRVTSYVDSGDDETNDFNGYNFTFSPDGTLTATNGTTTYTGTWSVTGSNSNSSDDDGSSSDSDIDFNIFFPVPDTDDFEDLNDDWDIVTHSDTTINLIDISGGNGGTDTLVFTKN